MLEEGFVPSGVLSTID